MKLFLAIMNSLPKHVFQSGKKPSSPTLELRGICVFVLLDDEYFSVHVCVFRTSPCGVMGGEGEQESMFVGMFFHGYAVDSSARVIFIKVIPVFLVSVNCISFSNN